jgi:hypothetical protein
MRPKGTFELGMTMRRRVSFEHPKTLTTSTAIEVVPPRRQLALSAMAAVSMWRAGELVAACTRDLLQSAFTFWQRCISPPLGLLVYDEEGDDIEVDYTMMWAVKRIDSVKHNMC